MNRLPVLLGKYPIAAILAVVAVVRLAFLLSYYSDPQWDQLLVDSLFHDRWAASIASGNILGGDVFFRAPFYVYVLGGLYALVGHSLLAARLFGHVVGLVSVYLTFCLAGRLFSRRTALAATLIHALYPIAVYFESELLVDNFFTMLVELSVLLLFVSSEKNRPQWYFITGLVLGLAAITRPVILALVPLYIIWVFVLRGSGKRSISRGLILLAGLILMIAPVTLRNTLVADDFVLVSSSGGINFFI
ncbi:MAG: glycosyltransferase family 39 protein, partial [Candidatus Zixiibacteriota bacterium]